MAKLDGFLNQLASRGGSALYLNPGAPATVELPGGHRAMLGIQDLLSPLIDELIHEVLPESNKDTYLRGDLVVFHREHGGNGFEIRASRAEGSCSLLAHRVAGTGTASPRSPSMRPPAHPSDVTHPGVFPWEGLLSKLLEMGGSDLYLSPGEPPLVRHHGTVEPIPDWPITPPEGLTAWLQSLSPPRHWKAFQDHGQADFCHLDAVRECRLRVNLAADGAGPSAALRVVPEQIPDDEVLALPSTVLELADIPQGLVLISGTPGSGRSTTLAALLRRAAQKRGGFLISVEDSLEFKIPQAGSVVRQRETGGDGVDQRRTLRAALKQAPDVLAVDAMRDGASVLQILEAGLSGRLVLVVMEASSALGTLERLVDSQPPESQHLVRALLTRGLKAVAHQVLLRRAGGGRVAAFETIFHSPEIQKVLETWDLSKVPKAMKSGRAYGQVTQAEALAKLVADQQVEAMEAYALCHDRQSFVAACKAAKLDFDPRRKGQVA